MSPPGARSTMEPMTYDLADDLVDLAKVQHVRTMAGVKKYHLPIGSLITAKSHHKFVSGADATDMVLHPSPGDVLYSQVTPDAKIITYTYNPDHDKWENPTGLGKGPADTAGIIDTWKAQNPKGEVWGLKATEPSKASSTATKTVKEMLDHPEPGDAFTTGGGVGTTWTVKSFGAPGAGLVQWEADGASPKSVVWMQQTVKDAGLIGTLVPATSANDFGLKDWEHDLMGSAYTPGTVVTKTSTLDALPAYSQVNVPTGDHLAVWTKSEHGNWSLGAGGTYVQSAAFQDAIDGDHPVTVLSVGPTPKAAPKSMTIAPAGHTTADEFASKPIGTKFVNAKFTFTKMVGGVWLDDNDTSYTDAEMTQVEGSFNTPSTAAPPDEFHTTGFFEGLPVGTTFIADAPWVDAPGGHGKPYYKIGPDTWAVGTPDSTETTTDYGMGTIKGHIQPGGLQDFGPKPIPDMAHSDVSVKDAPIGSHYYVPDPDTGKPIGTYTYTKIAPNQWTTGGSKTFSDVAITAAVDNAKKVIANTKPKKGALGSEVTDADMSGLPTGTIIAWSSNNEDFYLYTKAGDDHWRSAGAQAEAQFKEGTWKGSIAPTGFDFTDTQLSGGTKHIIQVAGEKNVLHGPTWAVKPPPFNPKTSPTKAPSPSVPDFNPADVTDEVLWYADIPGNKDPDWPARSYEGTLKNFGTVYTEKGLTPDQAGQIKNYTGAWAGTVNRELRDESVSEDDPGVRNMDGAMRPIAEDTMFYRAVPTTSVGVGSGTPQEIYDALKAKIGKPPIRDKGYLSTSYDLEGSTVQGQPFFTLRIRAPKGTPAVFAQPLSGYQSEHEVILSRGLPLKVNNVEWHRDKYGNNNVFILDVTAEPEKLDAKIKYNIKAGQDAAGKHKVSKPAPVPGGGQHVITPGKTTQKEMNDAPIGTVMHAASGDYTKQPDGSWSSSSTGKVFLPGAVNNGTLEKPARIVTGAEFKAAPVGSVYHAVNGFEYTKHEDGMWYEAGDPKGHPFAAGQGTLEKPSAGVKKATVQQALDMLYSPHEGDKIAFAPGHPITYQNGEWVDDAGTAHTIDDLADVADHNGVWAVTPAKPGYSGTATPSVAELLQGTPNQPAALAQTKAIQAKLLNAEVGAGIVKTDAAVVWTKDSDGWKYGGFDPAVQKWTFETTPDGYESSVQKSIPNPIVAAWVTAQGPDGYVLNTLDGDVPLGRYVPEANANGITFAGIKGAPVGATLTTDSKVTLTKTSESLWTNTFGEAFTNEEVTSDDWAPSQYANPEPSKPVNSYHTAATYEETLKGLNDAPIGTKVATKDGSATFVKTAPNAQGYEWLKEGSAIGSGEHYAVDIIAKYVDPPALPKKYAVLGAAFTKWPLATLEGAPPGATLQDKNGILYIKQPGGWWANTKGETFSSSNMTLYSLQLMQEVTQ